MTRRILTPRRAFIGRGAAAALVVVAAGCAGRTATTTRTAAGDVSPRWSATLLSKSASAPSGSVVLGPASGERQSVAVISLEGAPSSGAVLPWRLYQGGCTGTAIVVGSAGDYPLIQLRADGTGSATATLPIDVPTAGIYSVRIFPSPTDMDVALACGELRQGVL